MDRVAQTKPFGVADSETGVCMTSMKATGYPKEVASEKGVKASNAKSTPAQRQFQDAHKNRYGVTCIELTIQMAIVKPTVMLSLKQKVQGGSTTGILRDSGCQCTREGRRYHPARMDKAKKEVMRPRGPSLRQSSKG